MAEGPTAKYPVTPTATELAALVVTLQRAYDDLEAIVWQLEQVSDHQSEHGQLPPGVVIDDDYRGKLLRAQNDVKSTAENITLRAADLEAAVMVVDLSGRNAAL